MKKQYIEPKSRMIEIVDEELICLSTSEYEINTASDMETKKRESVDFSDEESIW